MSKSDEVYFSIACGNCGKGVKESMAWFKEHCNFACPYCSTVFNACDKKLGMALNDFEHSIRNHGF